MNIVLENSKIEKKIVESNELDNFIHKHEEYKRIIPEKDQYHMVMQLLQCAYESEISKTKEEFVSLAEQKWKIIRSQIKDLWDFTPTNKYQIVMARISTMNIWNVKARKNGLELIREDSDSLSDCNKKYIPLPS